MIFDKELLELRAFYKERLDGEKEDVDDNFCELLKNMEEFLTSYKIYEKNLIALRSLDEKIMEKHNE